MGSVEQVLRGFGAIEDEGRDGGITVVRGAIDSRRICILQAIPEKEPRKTLHSVGSNSCTSFGLIKPNITCVSRIQIE